MARSGNSAEKGILVYGGTFNPVHIGHLRLAIEAKARLGKRISRVEFVPSANPPHKSSKGILPFALRVKLLNAVLKTLPDMYCNEIEAQRPGLSYTYDTLREYGDRARRDDLYFLLGSQDFALLPTWRRGLELPRLCNLVIAPRDGFLQDDFVSLATRLWPYSSLAHAETPIMQLHNCGKIYYLSIPQLEISASQIREIWLAGGNVDYLTPQPVLDILAAEKELVTACWQEK